MVIVSNSSVLAGDACPADTLGVSRILEVDTNGGPWYGAPNGDPNFLAPGEVVLTFDDGPSPKDTREVLAALAKECTKATFFVVGEMVALYPEIVKEVAEQGHTIGTHTWSHPNLARLSLPDDTREIEATFDAAQKASPEPVAPFFRYPYLSSSKLTVDYLKSRNIGQFAIDIVSSDWRVGPPTSSAARLSSQRHSFKSEALCRCRCRRLAFGLGHVPAAHLHIEGAFEMVAANGELGPSDRLIVPLADMPPRGGNCSARWELPLLLAHRDSRRLNDDLKQRVQK
jgi:peptidoglycan/xylan/chitin deacetylase (PgdA/CDA1 family)